MQCPRCENAELLSKDRSGIEIDYCPDCRGIWLDRGELEKLIERSCNHQAGDEHHSEEPEVHKLKRNLITELFDF
ncbi:zf-TFIIB domain-containing protein [Microbulbifer sp. SAOS-129_SWC]|uniref:TFIIB-type zinc ribbon-containing protein n=1 Tax=Microbulbifer sp. SAOS-129_SWC TaxID=3145235 RepID=UPI003217025F